MKLEGLKRFLRSADTALLDTVYPLNLECLSCRGPSLGHPLCADCAQMLEDCRIPAPICPVCGHPLQGDAPCAFCAGDGLVLRSAYTHTGVARDLVHTLKYEAISAPAAVLAEEMARAVESLGPFDTATWVTMPAQRRRERGIDHGRLLAEAVARRLGIPCEELLTRDEKKKLQTQAGLGREERLRNLRDVFSCERPVRGSILLVDDVMTTGSTARVCRDALMAAGASAVTVVTATQAGSK